MTTSAGVCATCGAALPAGAAFCLACGKPTGLPPQDPGPSTLEKLQTALADRYEVERELGRGGMATVYLARDIRHDRRVAIKVLLPELAASVGGDRFVREIRVAAKLQHPHILTLYDSGDADGLLFYVMPFVEGESLRDRLDRDKMLGVEEALGLTIEVAEALGYAHTQGVVHRDIKPENILISNGHALVADFGIARAVSAAEEHKLTQTGSAVGTPLYMSPEQAMGDEVGPTSDLYSLGCMAFELLTGQPPFTGANARAIMARHTMEPPPSIRLVRDTVPEEVEEAVLWALAKVPADRPKDAAAFIDALATPLAATTGRRSPLLSRMTTAPRITQIRRAEQLQRKRRWLGAAVAGVAVVGGLVGWLALSGGPGGTATADGLDPKTIAVLYFDDNSPGSALGYLADGLTEELIGTLREVPELRVISRGGAEQVRGAGLPMDSVARLLGAGTLVRGSVEPEGSDIRVNVQLVEGGSGETFQRSSFRRPAADPLALRAALAQEVAGLVRARLGEEIRLREQRAGTRDVEAWVLLQRAERHRRQFDSLAGEGDTIAAWSAWARADSLLRTAQGRDRDWIEPRTERGRLAYARSRLAVDDLLAAERWIAAGTILTDSALALDGRDPDALELRGNLRYWKWLLQLERDPARAQALLMNAKADLEQAKLVRPLQAGAWASLSHLYNQTGTSADVKNAAQRALEADAFLGNADVILQRIFYASYDDGDVIGARDACAQGVRRFPGNPRFTECRLMMMTMRGDSADADRAWRLADSLVALSPAVQHEYQRLAGGMWTAAVLARAGLRDSARATAQRATGDPSVDPSRDLANIAAFVYTLLGDSAQALMQLQSYLTVNPARREAFAQNAGWWFRPLEASPAFRQLVGAERP